MEFTPTASWENLRHRAKLLKRLRRFFDDRGFLEVETPVLSHETVVDRHLDPFTLSTENDAHTDVHVDARPDVQAKCLYLQTSPEFHLKRMLAAGATAIFEVTKAFRRGETGTYHNPEFTIVEWYRTGDDMHAGIDFLGELICHLLHRTKFNRMTYREAFQTYARLDPFDITDRQLVQLARNRLQSVPQSLSVDDRDSWLDLFLVEQVEPNLGKNDPLILYEYPPSQAALAQVRNDDHPVAERFEMYVDGLELANGYHELLDAEELVNRNEIANAQRVADGKKCLASGTHLVDAMKYGLPPCSGVALGFDRLAMLSVEAKSLREVIAFPHDIA